MPPATNPRIRPVYVLVFGVLAVSSAALLIRLADAPPLVVGAFRLGLASVVVAPAALLFARDDFRTYTRSSLLLTVVSGLFLALHFGFWIASLSYTSVTSSVVLVTTTPLWVALLAPVFTSDVITWRTVLGAAIAVAGAAVITYGDAGAGAGTLLGNALALGGAFGMVGHRLTGRVLRAKIALLPFVAVTYPVAAATLAGLALMLGQPLTGYSPPQLGYMALLGLGPQLAGHSALNWALGHMSALAVSTAVTAEPLGATMMAWLGLNEAPTITQAAGGVVVLAGVYLTLSGEVVREQKAGP